MKPKKKMHDQEEYELDNYLNDEDLYYQTCSNGVMWYSWEQINNPTDSRRGCLLNVVIREQFIKA